MLLATYQPKESQSSRQNQQYDCFRDKLGGEYPVFCFPARTLMSSGFARSLRLPANLNASSSSIRTNMSDSMQ